MNEKPLTQAQITIIDVAKHQTEWTAKEAIERARYIVNEALKVEHVPMFRTLRVIPNSQYSRHITEKQLNQMADQIIKEKLTTLYLHPRDLESFISQGIIYHAEVIFGTDIKI